MPRVSSYNRRMTDPAFRPAPADVVPAGDERWFPPVQRDEGPHEQTVASRIIGVVLAFLVGVAYGAIGTVAHAWAPSILGVVIPLGLVLGILGVGMLLLGLRIVLGSRLPAAAAAFGMILMIGILLMESTGGSVLIPQGPAGLVWTIAPGLIAVLVIAWPKLPERRAQQPGVGAGGASEAQVSPLPRA